MECEDWDGLSSDSELLEQDLKDEEEYNYTSNSSSKLQFRKVTSVARWNSRVRMAEVVERKGQLWTTTGIVRSGKLYCSIEETLFLMEIGALLLLRENDESISLETMYQQLAEEKDGCFWELYEVYRHLKSLGYIVGRHGIPWSMKSVKRNTGTVSSEGTSESLEVQSPQDCNSVIERLIKMDLNELKLVFDVYLPNGKFRKSSPGDPSYVVSLIRGQPPSKIEIEAIERQCGGIPLKFCLVEHGRVSFYSFGKVELPVLP
ncbi:tRNA-splicing endonuclease subunit Sen54 [Eucalyptus grandis]|uniref:tRNA-splicing endonuclease subunit Sen54 n=1 Tax=Eucalyptus grandis TaxID=71139 RepID=UPI00192EF98E|nr:tRNA-splicing endonuclease subunit Sen54 [Eucalyptus grandis]XP_010044021.2 tRNA-splicing endonuclease subunit Sen54 [Eucalyptus grandis]XP_010044022.2 tRNA-splicing endonuclease subunit Sen54 [Eucalyptus grandis]XP_039163213.1 tRNA-splicing endonuclease subunit Sen54 [Eucalyptus grandis]